MDWSSVLRQLAICACLHLAKGQKGPELSKLKAFTLSRAAFGWVENFCVMVLDLRQ
ncbi:unnamed protein product [Phyllotreta striolata]|uniref:Uncharacterized protein n=1 Tax=Phyllotreta striolata TaxID=444603 RepID=A0A9N9TV53_PHYSR|nr:unnamed protein product [Phyllotreta striolata]